jgi:arylsulfatase A
MRAAVKKCLLALGVTTALVGPSQANAQERAPEPARPNVVFILADDLGWNQVGFDGSTFYETPNIDSIARDGMRFTHAYAAAPVCSPTRSSIMTGKSPARTHITDYIPGSPYPYALLKTPYRVPALPLEEVTVAELMKTKGYATGIFGKWHLNKDKNYAPGRPGDPGSQGFDEVLATVKPEPDADPLKDAHHTLEITERSLQFIDRHKKEPFFLYVAYHTVHRPIMERPELIAKYAAKPHSKDPINNPIMGAMIETMDKGIGRLLARLKQDGLDDNTMVIFYSDNGGLEQLQSQYPYRGGKATVWQGGFRVPLAVRWPGKVAPGSVSDDLVTSDDFFPTFAAMIGAKRLPKDIDGLSMVPTLTGKGSNGRDTLYFHYPHYHHLGFRPGGAIIRGKYKLIEWFEGSIAGFGKPYTLYNIDEDVDESDDLSLEKPEVVADLAAALKAWRKKVGAGEMMLNPNFQIDRADWRFEDSPGDDSK